MPQFRHSSHPGTVIIDAAALHRNATHLIVWCPVSNILRLPKPHYPPVQHYAPPTTPLFIPRAITLLRFLRMHFIVISMQHTAFHSPIGSSDLEADPVFNVVIVYEDFDTGKHAKETFDFLVSNLGHQCRFSNQMWKFDVLAIPKLREMAAKDALAADIIIISCHGNHNLSSDVKAWINSWLYEPNNAIALVALFSDANPCGENHNLRAYLAEVANRAHMEFFAQPNPAPVKYVEGLFESSRALRPINSTLNTLAGGIQRDQTFPHWGINE
jgi:hypothetical protein